MANLSITNKCNRKCVYCFAGDTLDEYGETFMSESVFYQALDYLERSGMKQVRLLGGEPTLHPSFMSMTKNALARDFEILLFTNGLINSNVIDFLAEIPTNKISILLNTVHPNEKSTSGIAAQKRTMKALGEKIAVGINLFSENQDMLYLLDYIIQFGLKKEIRLGISHTVLSKTNVYLHPKNYHKIGRRIAQFKAVAQKVNITLGFDCGFVPCMFPEDSLELLEVELQKAGNCCHPIIDLLTDGTFIPCYPLNNFQKIKLNNTITARELCMSFDQSIKPYCEAGVFAYCTSCPFFNSRCNGGCLSFRMQRFIN